MGLLKKIGTAVKNVGAKVGKAVDNVAKKLATSNSAIVSSIGNIVDAIIPDETKSAMTTAASRDGEVKVEKVEETVRKAAAAQGVTDNTIIKEVVHATATQIAEETATTINDKGAETKVTTKEKATAFIKKYWKWLVGGAAALLALIIALATRKRKGGRKFRR